jgi:hypothetical protein
VGGGRAFHEALGSILSTKQNKKTNKMKFLFHAVTPA